MDARGSLRRQPDSQNDRLWNGKLSGNFSDWIGLCRSRTREGAISSCWVRQNARDQKTCSSVLAIRDCRAVSCLHIRAKKFRAAAIPAPRNVERPMSSQLIIIGGILRQKSCVSAPRPYHDDALAVALCEALVDV